MRVTVLLAMIMAANLLYAVGSLLNEYSLLETLLGVIIKAVIEVACLYHVAKGKRAGLYVLITFWILGCGVSLWYGAHAESWSDRIGLFLNVMLYVLLSVGVFRLYRRQVQSNAVS